ncbi:hypothetical protein A2U01_0066397, partial [Trifolium medium]|nr:hypothetical protein [Trifolium medium]
AEIQRLTQELQAQREELDRQVRLNQEMRENMQEWMNEQIRIAMNEQRREMDAYFRQLLAFTSRNAPNDQTDPPVNEDSTEFDNEDADNSD